MNIPAVTHRGRGIDCYPLDEHTFRIRLTTAKGDFDRAEICYCMNKYAWSTQRQTLPLPRIADDDTLDYYQIDLTGDDTRLCYLFLLYYNSECFYFSEEGLSRTYDFERAYYTFFQYPYIFPCNVHRHIPWTDTTVMYQIFPERFANGMGEKPYITAPWDATPTPRMYLGGDLPGVTQHLDYLSDLGVNCLYFTPIHPSPTNHKYSIVDYYDVDAGFGGQAAFRELVQAAHARGMRVLLDGVFNHCSEHHPFFEDVKRCGKASPYYDFFLIDGDFPSREKGNYRTFGFSSDMPKLNTGIPAVIDYFCGVGAWWIREFGIDGWRLDVMDEISDDFLRAFRKAVKAANPDALILGEAWHDPRAWLAGDELDGVMNYGLTKALIDYLVDGALTARQAASRLTRLFFRTTSISARMMMNLLDSHDTDRFLTLLRGDRQRLKLALCLLFFFPGMPCVYYGDEIGMTGGYDPDCRKGFIWDETAWDAELRRHVQLLARLKTGGRLAGDVIRISASDDVLTLEREELTLLINASSRAARYCFRGREGQIAANGFVILDADASIIKPANKKSSPKMDLEEEKYAGSR